MADQEIVDLDVEQEKPCIVNIVSLSDDTKAYSTSGSSTENDLTDESGTPRRERLTTTADIVSLANLNGYFGENVDFEDFYETQHYTLICRISDKFFESIKHIMAHRAVGVAFEGQNLGCGGVLSLVQIATESEVIIFDMIRLGNQAFEAGLQTVLQSEHLIKVIHDCRWIAELLRYQHQISMANVFDTQVANAFVYRNLTGGKWPNNVESLHDCLKKYLNLPSQDLNFAEIREHYSEENEKVWLVRPLPFELLDAASDSVIHLLRLQRVLLAEMLVEFKAAVDIYLNHSSGTTDNMKTCRTTRHLLPIAITYIHTFMREKAESSNRMDPQSPNSVSFVSEQTATSNSEPWVQRDQHIVSETQDSPKTQCEPSREEAQASRRKKSSPRKVTRPSSQRAKGFYKKFCKGALSDEDTSSASEWEKIDTDIVEEAADVKVDKIDRNLPSEPMTVKRVTKRPVEKKSTPRKTAKKRKSTYKARLPSRRFQCEICQKKFPSSTTLANHRPTHSDERLFKCDVCEKSFKTPGTLYGHKLIHSGKRPHMCDICGKCFLVKTALRKHMVSHSGERSYFKCDICNKSYISLRGLRIHKEVHTGQRPYQCDVCSKSFTSLSFLTQHKKIHTGYKPFKCSMCDKSFSRVYHRDVHYKSVHIQDKAYPCKMCHRRFVDMGSLNYHMKLHEGNKPHKCHVCDRTFTFPSQRDIHYKKTHCEQKLYQCTVCYLRFEGMSTLLIHKRTHTEDKPYKCPECDKTFKRNDNRNTHYKRIHSHTENFVSASQS